MHCVQVVDMRIFWLNATYLPSSVSPKRYGRDKRRNLISKMLKVTNLDLKTHEEGGVCCVLSGNENDLCIRYT